MTLPYYWVRVSPSYLYWCPEFHVNSPISNVEVHRLHQSQRTIQGRSSAFLLDRSRDRGIRLGEVKLLIEAQTNNIKDLNTSALESNLQLHSAPIMREVIHPEAYNIISVYYIIVAEEIPIRSALAVAIDIVSTDCAVQFVIQIT